MRTVVAVMVITGVAMLASPTRAQVPDAGAGVSTGNCVVPIYAGGDGRSHPCSSLSSPTTTRPAANMNQAIANAEASAILGLIGGLLSSNKNDAEARNRAAAAAAAAEQERQAEVARQQALADQKRQEMFNRLSQSLKLSGLATLSLKGFDNNQGLHLKGFGDNTSDTGGGLQLKGFGNSSSTPSDSQHVVTSPFGSGGNPCPPPAATNVDSNLVDLRSDVPLACPKMPTGDANVVDLRDVQQGVDLAVVAGKAAPADRQSVLDQALDAANGDHSIQLSMASGATAPVVNQDGLRAFQQANAAYRQARDSAYQHEQAWNQEEKKREGAYAIISTYQAQLATDFRNHIDAMMLAQKQETMAKIFDAAVQQRIAYGKTWAEYLAASERYKFDKLAAEDQLMQLAQTGPYDPDAGRRGAPDSDLKLVLPFLDPPTQAPTKADLDLLLKVELESTSTKGPGDLALNFPSDNRLHPADLQEFPPAVVRQYKSDSSFQKQMNAEHEAVFGERDHVVKSALSELGLEFDRRVAELQKAGRIQPGIAITNQERANPQVHAELQQIRTQLLADFNCKLAHANWQANDKWQAWIEAQTARLTGKPVPIYVPAP
jgi:hypothetical protein